MWNGLPCIDFQEKIVYPLNNGLGSVYVKGSGNVGATLLQTVRQRDPGGVLGNPPRAAAAAGIVDDSNARDNKAFHSILNYILPSSEIYMMFVREFAVNSSGVAIYMVIPRFGSLATPPRLVKSREDSWSRASMDALKMPYTEAGYFKWLEIVEMMARKLGKSATQMKDKFIDGLPSFFQSEKAHNTHKRQIHL